jgi:hypothetical protein
MATNQEAGEHAFEARQPAYYRWRDERSPLIVELNLNIVPRILADLLAGEQVGQEAGGILVGSFPRSVGMQTLRIDEYELVGRRGADGLPYILHTEQRSRFTTIRKRVATREVSAVGFFRSHLRTGPFELTIADRDLLAAEFKNTIHVALLVAKDQSKTTRGGSQRYLATFFVSVNGIIQNRVDPATFPFSAEELEQLNQTLSKLHLDVPMRPAGGLAAQGLRAGTASISAGASGSLPGTRVRGRAEARTALSVFAVLCLLFVAWGWQRQGTRLTGPVFLGPSGLDLTVEAARAVVAGRTILHIDWNHQCPLLLDATAGHLTISNDQTHSVVRNVDLTPLELTAGRVDVELDEQPVDVSLALAMSDATSVAQQARPATGAAAR